MNSKISIIKKKLSSSIHKFIKNYFKTKKLKCKIKIILYPIKMQKFDLECLPYSAHECYYVLCLHLNQSLRLVHYQLNSSNQY